MKDSRYLHTYLPLNKLPRTKRPYIWTRIHTSHPYLHPILKRSRPSPPHSFFVSRQLNLTRHLCPSARPRIATFSRRPRSNPPVPPPVVARLGQPTPSGRGIGALATEVPRVPDFPPEPDRHDDDLLRTWTYGSPSRPFVGLGQLKHARGRPLALHQPPTRPVRPVSDLSRRAVMPVCIGRGYRPSN